MYVFQSEFSPDICPGVGLLDHMATLVLGFQGTSILFPTVATQIYSPISSGGGFPFLHILCSILFFNGELYPRFF